MNKGCYIGQEVIARLDTYDKVKQTLMGLRLAPGELPPPGSTLKVADKDAGRITSVTYSPRLASPIALAYVRRAYCEPGTQVQVSMADLPRAAQVVALPFI
jgi:glycine cleavage system aminomethyltransferase T